MKQYTHILFFSPAPQSAHGPVHTARLPLRESGSQAIELSGACIYFLDWGVCCQTLPALQQALVICHEHWQSGPHSSNLAFLFALWMFMNRAQCNSSMPLTADIKRQILRVTTSPCMICHMSYYIDKLFQLELGASDASTYTQLSKGNFQCHVTQWSSRKIWELSVNWRVCCYKWHCFILNCRLPLELQHHNFLMNILEKTKMDQSIRPMRKNKKDTIISKMGNTVTERWYDLFSYMNFLLHVENLHLADFCCVGFLGIFQKYWQHNNVKWKSKRIMLDIFI